eukprot:TRINITY_DN5782_c0_g1_i1.p1 TRINITY_DN5782_c0_g1~~TRINITY_DN5782_c0_g1_i1.p1  ORF type:complete len:541 (+),score=215.32 TRINITY_DN5782_c0_g1_i1:365-1987(+)
MAIFRLESKKDKWRPILLTSKSMNSSQIHEKSIMGIPQSGDFYEMFSELSPLPISKDSTRYLSVQFSKKEDVKGIDRSNCSPLLQKLFDRKFTFDEYLFLCIGSNSEDNLVVWSAFDEEEEKEGLIYGGGDEGATIYFGSSSTLNGIPNIYATAHLKRIGTNFYFDRLEIIQDEDLLGFLGLLPDSHVSLSQKSGKLEQNSLDDSSIFYLFDSLLSTLEIERRAKIWNIIEIKRGDLTEEKVDAIVNPVDWTMMGRGSMVSRMIHSRAGGDLIEECRRFKINRNRVEIGDCRVTPGFNLNASNVIHVHGPSIGELDDDAAKYLEIAYQSCLLTAANKNLKSVSFPSIGTGSGGYSCTFASTYAIRSIINFLYRGKPEEENEEEDEEEEDDENEDESIEKFSERMWKRIHKLGRREQIPDLEFGSPENGEKLFEGSKERKTSHENYSVFQGDLRNRREVSKFVSPSDSGKEEAIDVEQPSKSQKEDLSKDEYLNRFESIKIVCYDRELPFRDPYPFMLCSLINWVKWNLKRKPTIHINKSQ